MSYIEIWSPNISARGMKKNIIVFHTNEPGPYAPGKFPGTAESLGLYLKRPDVQASYHKIVDRNGDVCRCVPDNKDAWAAGGIANNEGLHICLSGWAAQSREEWLQYPQQLDQAAREVADWCKQENIPAVWLEAARLVKDEWGVTGHGDTAIAWKQTDHTDPGPGFPRDYIINKAIQFLGGAPALPEGDSDVSAAEDVVTQFMGEQGDGWTELAPQRDAQGKSFSIFKFLRGLEPNVSKQTLVEAIATVVFELTLRIRPYRGKDADRVPETVLGHAAAGAGLGLDNRELLIQVLSNQNQIAKALNVSLPEPILGGAPIPAELRAKKVTALDSVWTAPESK